MKNLTSITLLVLATALHAQEVEQQPPEIEPTIDPIDAEVFADDMVTPDAVPATDMPELPPEPVHEAPTDEQTVPVAEETVTVQLPSPATAEEELIYQYDRYLMLMQDGVYDEADSVAKRVVELAIEVKGPQSRDFSKALTNLAIVQHRSGNFDAAQQNFQSAIEIIENNEDRLNGELINPLKGLGAAQLESGRPDLANGTFRRAVHVSHVNDGPHNLDQVAILESLAETNLRLGSLDDAKQNQDMIYALNVRANATDPLGLVPSLMRRAEWQLRAGLINDYRVTLRRVVRIIEVGTSADNIQLVDPLTRLGQSFFYVDLSGTQSFQPTTMITGEVYFKRALRIATESPEPDWKMIAETSLALGDYYMFQGNEQRARKVYKESWQNLSGDDDRLTYRAESLEQPVTLRENPVQSYISAPTNNTESGPDVPYMQGNITIAYEVSSRGRATNLKIVESQPGGFADMERLVQRELRGRIFRPRFVEAEPVKTDGQILIHRYYYMQADLDALAEDAADTESEST